MKTLQTIALVLFVCSCLSVSQRAFSAEDGDSDGCPQGQMAVNGECRVIAYDKKEKIDFDGLGVNASGDGPSVFLIKEPSRPDLLCEEEFKQGDEEYRACMGLTPQPQCPEGQLWVSGKCRDPQYLARIPKHDYQEPPANFPDSNAPVNEKAASLGKSLREKFNQTRCHYVMEDIAILKTITAQAKARGLKKLDLSPLIAQPKDPASWEIDPGLPMACGYNNLKHFWFYLSFHCLDQGTCFSQGFRDYPHTCTKFRNLPNSPIFANFDTTCDHDTSYRNGGDGGDMVLIPLGSGVFIQVFQSPQHGEVYHGLIFSSEAYARDQRIHNDSLTVSAWDNWAKSPDGKAILAVMDDKEKARLLRMIGQAKAHVQEAQNQ